MGSSAFAGDDEDAAAFDVFSGSSCSSITTSLSCSGPDPVVRESCAQVNTPETDPDGVLEGALDDVLD